MMGVAVVLRDLDVVNTVQKVEEVDEISRIKPGSTDDGIDWSLDTILVHDTALGDTLDARCHDVDVVLYDSLEVSRRSAESLASHWPFGSQELKESGLDSQFLPQRSLEL